MGVVIMNKMKYSDIPQLTRPASYQVEIAWNYLEHHLIGLQEDFKNDFELNPDFQRGHVWTEEQQIAYVEFKLRGGTGSDVIQCNCHGWMGNYDGKFQLVDGKQRLNAALRFLRNEIPAFGKYRNEYEDRIPNRIRFKWTVNDLKTREEVLRWYLEMNSGGTPHTKEELEKVKKMLGNGKL